MKKILDFIFYAAVKYDFIPYERVNEVQSALLVSIRDWADECLKQMDKEALFPRPEPSPEDAAEVRELISKIKKHAPALPGAKAIAEQAETALKEAMRKKADLEGKAPAPVEKPAPVKQKPPERRKPVREEVAEERPAPVAEVPESESEHLSKAEYLRMDPSRRLEKIREEEKERLTEENPQLQNTDWSRGLFKNWLDMAVRRRYRDLGIAEEAG